MHGFIALEEHWSTASLAEAQKPLNRFFTTDVERYEQEILDLDSIRIQKMNDNGVGLTVISQTGPAAQDEWDQAKAESMATEVNDQLAEKIKGHKDRFRAFALLSMHSPTQAAAELRRCVTHHGFVGALLYNTQRSGPDGGVDIYYDTPAYDPFWSVVQDLDVPVYMHPRNPTGLFADLYTARRFLMGPPLQFAQGVATHVLSLVTNGVFDRFPGVQVVIGHMGEHVACDLWRINHWFEDVYKHRGLEKTCKQSLKTYFARNIWVTTSGHFSTATLKHVIEEVGAERIMFSIDYPYERFEDACEWWRGVELEEDVKEMIGSGNAKRLLKLE